MTIYRMMWQDRHTPNCRGEVAYKTSKEEAEKSVRSHNYFYPDKKHWVEEVEFNAAAHAHLLTNPQ